MRFWWISANKTWKFHEIQSGSLPLLRNPVWMRSFKRILTIRQLFLDLFTNWKFGPILLICDWMSHQNQVFSWNFDQKTFLKRVRAPKLGHVPQLRDFLVPPCQRPPWPPCIFFKKKKINFTIFLKKIGKNVKIDTILSVLSIKFQKKLTRSSFSRICTWRIWSSSKAASYSSSCCWPENDLQFYVLTFKLILYQKIKILVRNWSKNALWTSEFCFSNE